MGLGVGQRQRPIGATPERLGFGWRAASERAPCKRSAAVGRRAASRTLDQKRSCFDASLGKLIATSKLDIIDDPLLAGGWGSRRYDGEGLTAKRRPIIESGLLRGYYLDSYYARKLGRAPTSANRSNLVFSPGAGTLDELLAKVGKAVLVTHFLGGNSNSTTGDFSHGISGFIVEGKPAQDADRIDEHRG